MSGHSKWATTHRQKGAADQKRGAIFTKLANGITAAARLKGGDPEANFNLRLAIEKAKAANMPKDNIERAIKRGTGELEGGKIEEITYEGFGPEKIAVIVQALTDNRNRAASEIKNIFTKHGGSLGSTNSVGWMFEHKGVIRIKKLEVRIENIEDEFELKLIDLGAQDIQKEDGDMIIYTAVADFQKVKEGLEKEGCKIDYAELDYAAKEMKKIDDPAMKEKIEKFFADLDECGEVKDFYTNVDL